MFRVQTHRTHVHTHVLHNTTRECVPKLDSNSSQRVKVVTKQANTEPKKNQQKKRHRLNHVLNAWRKLFRIWARVRLFLLRYVVPVYLHRRQPARFCHGVCVLCSRARSRLLSRPHSVSPDPKDVVCARWPQIFRIWSLGEFRWIGPEVTAALYSHCITEPTIPAAIALATGFCVFSIRHNNTRSSQNQIETREKV